MHEPFRRAPAVIQNSIRAFINLRGWHWFTLYNKVKPLLKGNRSNEEMEKLEKKLKVIQLKVYAKWRMSWV